MGTAGCPPQDGVSPPALAGQSITLSPTRSPQQHLWALNSSPELPVEALPWGLSSGERLLMPRLLCRSGMPWPYRSGSLPPAPVMGCAPLVPTNCPKAHPWQRRGLVAPSVGHSSTTCPSIQDSSGHPGPASSPAPFSARHTPRR